jgi:hypothetical protein
LFVTIDDASAVDVERMRIVARRLREALAQERLPFKSADRVLCAYLTLMPRFPDQGTHALYRMQGFRHTALLTLVAQNGETRVTNPTQRRVSRSRLRAQT